VQRLAVVIPVFNEERLLPVLVARLDAEAPPSGPDGPLERVVVLVDDGSDDASPRLVRELGERADVIGLVRSENGGKGRALADGFAAALGAGADVIIVQDADLEYDPRDHAACCLPIVRGDADAVIGSRYAGWPRRVPAYWHTTANRVITLLSNMTSDLKLSDVECGIKAFSAETLRRLRITERGFGVEIELVAQLGRLRVEDDADPRLGRRLRVVEVPVRYDPRGYDEGKKIGWRDGVYALWACVRHNLLGGGSSAAGFGAGAVAGSGSGCRSGSGSGLGGPDGGGRGAAPVPDGGGATSDARAGTTP